MIRLARYEAHPGRADEDHQRHHQEERQVDAGQRPLEHAQLVVALEGLRHAAATARPARPSGSRSPRRRRSAAPSRPRTTAAARSSSPPLPSGSIDRRLGRSAERLRGEPIGRGAAVAGRQRRRRARRRPARDRGSAARPARRGRPRPSARGCSVDVGRPALAQRRDVRRREVDAAPARGRCAPAWSLTSLCRSW